VVSVVNTIFKGDIVHTPTKDKFEIYEDSYLVVENGFIKGIFKTLEESYKSYEFKDFTNKLIIPGFVDLHLHAPQYPNMGLGLDKELIPWLNTYTFPEEGKYKDIDYAKGVFKKLINNLWWEGTTRSVVFSSIFNESTKLLMDMFIESGLGAYVGKVNMDRNSAPYLTEDTNKSLVDTEELIVEYLHKSRLVKPIITPRFIPTCSTELLKGLGKLSKKYDVPIQSHINENTAEVIWVKELYPESKNYASVYNDLGLFGQTKTIMAHCIHNTEEEISLMAENGVYVAHCPFSNLNLSSGMMPTRKLMEANINVGLASDISGGNTLSMPQIIGGAIQSSKMVWLNSNKELTPLTISEAFYLGTKGGGSFFGNVGSFEEGYEFDALIIDIENLTTGKPLSIEEKLQKFIYIGDGDNIIERYVFGKKIEQPYSEELATANS
jgi:guanine deaminase